jgi:phosphoribosyl-ATP pyrophosphohydrolase/phosphoribosyl-AMP cyclohydrolase
MSMMAELRFEALCSILENYLWGVPEMNSIIEKIKFDEKGLIPVATQDSRSGEVLILAFMNREALLKTLETGKVHYWSRSRNKLWLKGETSGNFQYVKSIYINCEDNSLLIKVEQVGNACHTGHYSCYFREVKDGDFVEIESRGFGTEDTEKNNDASSEPECMGGKTAYEKVTVNANNGEIESGYGILKELYEVISDRKKNPKEGSYTNYLFDKGIDKICKKIGEEAAEVIIAAKNNAPGEIIYEIADLYYHLFVLMVHSGVKPEDIYNELKKRR